MLTSICKLVINNHVNIVPNINRFPCPSCGNPAKQVSDMISGLNGVTFGMLWYVLFARLRYNIVHILSEYCAGSISKVLSIGWIKPRTKTSSTD